MFFSRDEKVSSAEHTLPSGCHGQYLIARVFTRRAGEYPDYREIERTR
jgi:hypothetical protein